MKLRLLVSTHMHAPREERDWTDHGIAQAMPEDAKNWSAMGNAGDFVLDLRGAPFTFIRLVPVSE